MSQEINPSVFRQIENKIDSMCAANKIVGATAARLARAEGMEAHARTGDIRLKKYGYSD